MLMKSRWMLAGVVGLAVFMMSSCTTSNGSGTISGTGFMWITTQGDQQLSAYSINLSNGAASLLGSAVPTGAGPIAIAIAPANHAILVANRDDNTVSYYNYNSDGSVANPCPPPKAAGCNTLPAGPVAGTPVALEVDPSGKFLFVANQANQTLFPPPNTADTVAVFTISGTGLTPAGFFASTGNGPAGLAASATGNFLYVANQFTSTVSILSYDANGNLTEAPTSPVTVGANPTGLAFSRCAGTVTATVSTNCPLAAPPGYLFVANTGSNTIGIFSACIQVTAACASANGTLTQVSSVGASGTRPVSFIVDPVLNFVYVVDNGSFQISQYVYSPVTGLLGLLSPSTLSTGASPLTGGITADGHWVFVPNNGGSSVSGFNLNPTTLTTPNGQLTVGPSVALAGQPSAVLIR